MKSNLGDLVRSTVLLECLGDDYFWLSDRRGAEILEWFLKREKIGVLAEYNIENAVKPGTIIHNLDNFPSAASIFRKRSLEWRGFVPVGKGEVAPANEKISALEPYHNAALRIPFQQALLEGLGFIWLKQDYAHPRIEAEIEADLGFNWNVHPEWVSKIWPNDYWRALELILMEKFTVSWQKGLNDFSEYIKWLASCRVIVTVDTLGLHLASALRKPVIAIVGPTDCREYSYGRIIWVTPGSRDCMPCHLPHCPEGVGCLTEILPVRVAGVVNRLMESLHSQPYKMALEALES